MLRRRSWLDAVLDDRVRGGLARLDPDLTDLLRLGAYQLFHMGSVPPYAAIAQTVELAKQRHGIGASKLANAVLRRLDRERDDLTVAVPPDPIDALAMRCSHPRWLVARWVARWGADETAALLEANNAQAPLVIAALRRGARAARGHARGVGRRGRRRAARARQPRASAAAIALRDLGAFQQGLFFVQDPAATLVTQYAAFPAGARVADLCAAPGGKARGALAHRGVRRRGRRLARRDSRGCARRSRAWRSATCTRSWPTRVPPRSRRSTPCSSTRRARGTGTFRRHPDARWRLRPHDIAVLAATQRSILHAAAATRRAGRTARLQHLLPRDRGERRPGGDASSPPIRSSRSSRRRRERCRRPCSTRDGCASCRSATVPTARSPRACAGAPADGLARIREEGAHRALPARGRLRAAPRPDRAGRGRRRRLAPRRRHGRRASCPNLTFGAKVIETCRASRSSRSTCTSWSSSPRSTSRRSPRPGASVMTIHVEAAPHLHRQLMRIKELGCAAGAVDESGHAARFRARGRDRPRPAADHEREPRVRRPGVHPRVGRQDPARARAARLRSAARRRSRSTAASAARPSSACWQAGADTFVAGNAVFAAKDPAAEVRALRALCAKRHEH